MNSRNRVGNDIVDLSIADIQHKYLDKRFLIRVFSQFEQEAITQSIDKNIILWSIWAAKEAAFKALKKNVSELVFSHQKFTICKKTLIKLQTLQRFDCLTGVLHYNNQIPIFLSWRWINNAVHCIGLLIPDQIFFDSWDIIHSKIVKLDQSMDKKTKELLQKYLTEKELISIQSDESLQTRAHAKHFVQSLDSKYKIEIIRPLLMKDKKESFSYPIVCTDKIFSSLYEISLSHDGVWCGIACSKFGKFEKHHV